MRHGTLHAVRIIALALLAALLPAAPPRVRSADELRSAIQAVDAIFSAEFEKDKTGSVTFGIVSGPQLVFSKSYGMAEIDAGKPATPETIYRIGSITKQLTAVMLLQLVEQGKVHLSDSAEKYFPELGKVPRWFPGAPQVTLLQLATHLSGLDREPANPAVHLRGPVTEWEKAVIESLPDLKYDHEPGTKYMYSNIGYAILGVAISRAAGRPYIEYVNEKILRPLGMNDTFFQPEPRRIKDLARGYVTVEGKPSSEESDRELKTGRGYKVPNGALFTTIADLGRWVSFQLGHGPEPVLPQKVWQDNLTRVFSADGGFRSGYGIGFMAMRSGETMIFGHGGSVAGFAAGAYYNPQAQTGIVFLRNVSGRTFRNNVIASTMEALSK